MRKTYNVVPAKYMSFCRVSLNYSFFEKGENMDLPSSLADIVHLLYFRKLGSRLDQGFLQILFQK